MSNLEIREFYMQQALDLAKESYLADEVPVGAIIVDENGKIIGCGRNKMQENNDACAHAEIEAIKMASSCISDWRLSNCTLYVTMEPCPMCAGAIINSRISEIVFGVRDSRSGACGSVIDLFSERFGHKPKVYSNVKANECREILNSFFKEVR